jgi:AAA ATPase domain
MPQDIVRVYRQCDPTRPPEPDDPRYVPCEGVRGSGNIAVQLATAIRFSDAPLHLLFAGYRGSGKTTELLRLKRSLENNPEDRFFVVYFQVDEDIDMNDPDAFDVLLAIVRQVGKAFRERAQWELHSPWLSRLVDYLEKFLSSDVELEKLELDAKIARLTAAIKNSPSVRERVRETLQPNASRLIEMANALLDEAMIRLRENGYRDLVIIVDNLDRLVLRDIPNSPFNTHEQLFIHQGSLLAQLFCHVVYILPTSLLFSPKAAQLMHIFGGHPYVLPMVNVIARDGTINGAGMNVMREMVRKRLALADVSEAEAFVSPATLDHLCHMSGGHVRSLFVLIRSACTVAGALPLTGHVVKQAVRDMSRFYEQTLNRAELDVLRQIDRTHALLGSDHDQVLLYNLNVLQYLNGAAWYAVNPVVRALERFKTP